MSEMECNLKGRPKPLSEEGRASFVAYLTDSSLEWEDHPGYVQRMALRLAATLKQEQDKVAERDKRIEQQPELSDEELSALIEACNAARYSVSRPRPPWPQHGLSAHMKLVDLEGRRATLRGEEEGDGE